MSFEKLVLAYSGNTAEILNTIDGYSRHKPRRKIFPRRLTFVPNIYHTLFGDLIGECFSSFRLFIFDLDYKKYDGHAKNRNYSYILTLVDGFSRKAYTCALKTKRAAETSAALDEILSGMANPYTFFASDSGSEGGVLFF